MCGLAVFACCVLPIFDDSYNVRTCSTYSKAPAHGTKVLLPRCETFMHAGNCSSPGEASAAQQCHLPPCVYRNHHQPRLKRCAPIRRVFSALALPLGGACGISCVHSSYSPCSGMGASSCRYAMIRKKVLLETSTGHRICRPCLDSLMNRELVGDSTHAW